MVVILNVHDDGYFERTWWWLFWTYLLMAILSVPDDGYFERIWWWLFWTYLMMVILSVPDDGYFERTWWWLFWTYLMMVILNVPDDVLKLVVRTKLDIHVFITITGSIGWWTFSPWGHHPHSSQCFDTDRVY